MHASHDIEAVRTQFESGKLVDPREGANTLDLIRCVFGYCGVGDTRPSERANELRKTIGDTERIVFVLVDGLGKNVLDRLSPNGFFRSNLARELCALAPSTTSCVLTSLATGVYPVEHGICGWFTYLPDRNRSTIPLRFIDRFSEESLTRTGIEPDELFPVPSLFPKMTATPRSLLPAEYWNSVYARYWRGETFGAGYEDLSAATDRVSDWLRTDRGRSFTYLYIPDIDHVSHLFGPDSAETLAVAQAVENELAGLAETLPEGARILCTADHGQITILKESNSLLFDGDPMLDLLRAPPSGEPRLPLFHVKPGGMRAFRDLFHERYGKKFLLLPMDEIDTLRLFGPGPMSPVARARFGDFAAIAVGAWTLSYSPPEKDPADAHLGRHGGLSPEEMRVPLIVR